MRLTKDLRTMLLGSWLVVTGLLVVVSTVISAITKAEESSEEE